MHLTGRNPHAAQHLPTIAQPRARRLGLRKAFKNLDTDFLRERTLDLAHAIPEPDDFPLLLDIHWSPPKNDQREHNENDIASAKVATSLKQRLRIFNRQVSAPRDLGFAAFACFVSFGELFGELFGVLGRS
jgi:hypothetical protein